MTKLLLLFVLLAGNNPNEIARINAFKKEAEKSFLAGNYKDAISRYTYLIDSMQIDEDEIALNLAHAYHQVSDTANARTYYAQASMSGNKDLKSIAYQQLGVMTKSPQTLPQSLQYFKASVKANPSNMDARYDYEMVKKLIDAQKQDQENEDNQDQENEENQEENQDQENQENKDGEQEQQEQENQEQENQDQENQDQEQQSEEEQEQEQQSEEEQDGEEQEQEQSTKEKLEEMNISEEKAEMILEAMRNSEIQYIQQQKRKPSKKKDTGKPDW